MDFTIIGRFPSIARAEQVYIELKDLFEAILQNRDINIGDDYRPTWVEEQAGRKYEIEWDHHLEWLDEGEEHLVQFREYVFVTSALSKPFNYPHPIIAMMKKLAQEVLVEKLYGEYIIALSEFNCTAPDDKIAMQITTQANVYLLAERRIQEYLITPWESYCLNPHLIVFNLLYGSYSRTSVIDEHHKNAIRQALQTLYNYQETKLEGKPLAKIEKETIRIIYSLKDYAYTLPLLSDEESLTNIIREVGNHVYSRSQGKAVQAQGKDIHIPEIFFYSPEVGFPAFYRYLEAHGCLNIRYSFSTVPYESRPEYI